MPSDKNNQIPFNEDNYTHNIERNNERKLDRRGFMKTLVGAGRTVCRFFLTMGNRSSEGINGAMGIKNIPIKKLQM